MSNPRLLLVEDDEAVRRFVRQALKNLEVEVVVCATVEEGMAAWQERPFHLVIADLTFPVGAGLTLVRYVLAQAKSLNSVKVVVFSGGLHAQMREQLEAMGVWRCLPKPSSLAEVETIAREGLDLANWPEGPTKAMTMETGGLQPNELAAIETFFDGDRQFYETFRESCIQQFNVDVANGDAACQAQDAVSLRRTAHSLKSVLQTLGYADYSVCARLVEDAAQHQPIEAAAASWQELRQRLVQSFGLTV